MPVNPLKFENRAPLVFSLSQNHKEINFCSKIFHDQSHLYPVCMIYENSFVLRLFSYDNLNRTKELKIYVIFVGEPGDCCNRGEVILYRDEH